MVKKEKLMLLAFLIAAMQLLVRLGCLGEYGFHQDELLYLALSDHLAWGYREVPPFIALIGAFSKALFGDTVAAARIIPSICAAAVVFVTGLITIRLGGKLFAVSIACIAVAFSPAFLATGALFIPQVFDELCWILSAYLLLIYLQDRNSKVLLYLGIVMGIGMLVKYTYVLYIIGLLLGIALHPKHRTLFKDRLFWLGAGIAVLIFLPHLWWQFQHNFPALHHYSELKETQLVYLSRFDFLIQQLLVNGTGVVVWLAGVKLLWNKAYGAYRYLGFSFLLVMAIMFCLNGKVYYAFGCFPPLFALGALSLEKLFKRATSTAKNALVGSLIVPNLLLGLIVLPYLPIDKAAKVFEWTYLNLGMHYPLKWEDQQIHNMNQNYADMIGWDELAQKTANVYQSLSPSVRKQTVIFAEKYGEAGAIDQYQEEHKLPPVISLCSSYALWAPSQIAANHIIYIGSNPPPTFTQPKMMAQVLNPYSRVVGMKIYLISNVNASTKHWYAKQWKAQRALKRPFS